MQNIIEWLDALIDFPGLSWMKYIIASVIILVILDAVLNLIISAVHIMLTGGRK